jgi:hypothetical protein
MGSKSPSLSFTLNETNIWSKAVIDQILGLA